MKMCDYGCGKEAKHPLKNGKWCCEKDWRSCPESREKNSKRMKEIQNRSEVKANKSKKSKEVWKDPKIKEKHRKSLTHTIEQFQEKYPFFSKKEEMRYNPDKPEEKEIQVHCKYHKCKNSKEKGGWFTPTKEQIWRRRDALEHDDGNDGCYFYCPGGCERKCCLYRLISDPNLLTKFKKYNRNVYKETNITLKKFSSKIKNIKLRGKKYGYELDHKYSIYDGFENNVDPKIIANWRNLQIMTIQKNRKKNKNSSITLEELLEEVKKEN